MVCSWGRARPWQATVSLDCYIWRVGPQTDAIESIFHHNAHDRIVIRKQSKKFPILGAKRAARLFRRNQSCAASWRCRCKLAWAPEVWRTGPLSHHRAATVSPWAADGVLTFSTPPSASVELIWHHCDQLVELINIVYLRTTLYCNKVELRRCESEEAKTRRALGKMLANNKTKTRRAGVRTSLSWSWLVLPH
jgi:hypothetical protein